MSNIFVYDPELKKVASLVKVAGEIRGRKKFQKIVYLLKNLGVSFREKFKLHYFGPYSADLQLEIDELVLFDVLSESGNDPYIYKIKDTDFEIDNEILQKKSLIQKLNSCDVRILELLSTYLYLLNQGYDSIHAKKKLKVIKSHLFHLWPEVEKLAKAIGFSEN